MADDRIVVDVQNTIVGASTTAQGAQGGVPMQGAAVATASKGGGRFGSFGAGLSAQMFIESGSRILSATGNQELASGISKASGYTFLVGRLAMTGGLDAAAWVSLLTKASADIITLVQDYNEKKREEATAMNALNALRIRGGAFGITAATVVNTNKYGMKSFTDRK